MGKTTTTQQMEAKLAKLKEAEWDSETSDDEQIEEQDETSFDKETEFVKLTKTKPSAGEQDKQSPSNVIYLGRIPHGFYEDQMMGFFQQFGDVSRVRLARNRKTGQSKHYAFIEFDDIEVAAIVAKTMHKYRLFDHVLQCHVLTNDQIHPEMFKGANKPFHPKDWAAIAQEQHNQPRSKEKALKNLEKLVQKENKKRKKLEELGIEYEFSGYQALLPPSARPPATKTKKKKTSKSKSSKSKST